MCNNKMKFMLPLFTAVMLLVTVSSAQAQFASTSPKGYGLKIFRVESGAYPFVQVYIRTFDQDMRPLVNLNELNIGVMVQGRVYDITKRQYMIESIANRIETIRSVFVLDTSATMAGGPFEEALKAAARFIDGKRPRDQVAIIATADNSEGYEITSNFERDYGALARRLVDLRAVSQSTRLYDSIGAAMQMCGLAGQGGVSTSGADYIATCSVIVFSDGKDEGSALTRNDLMTRITNLELPIPIYSLAYSKIDPVHLKNLQALSKNSFGKYFPIGKAVRRMTKSVEEIQDILQNDYVVTIRSYLPVDGKKHALKVGIEYPSRSGKMRYQGGDFEAIEAPPLPKILEAQQKLDGILKQLPDGDPYLKGRFSPQPVKAETK